MEIKATLQKPYEENEKLDFIVQYNHNLGYIIEETETELKFDLLKNLISSDPEKEEELISLLKRLRDLVKEMD